MKKSSQQADVQLQGVPTDAVSSLRMSADGALLAATSWDHTVRCWGVQWQPNGEIANCAPHAMIQHEAPVLCCDIASDNATIFSGGCDNKVLMWNAAAGTNTQQIGQHEAPVKALRFSANTNLVVTGSWDCTIACWDTRSPTVAHGFTLDERVYAMDLKGDACVAVTASNQIHVFDMNAGTQVSKLTSPLQHQLRCVSIFHDITGFTMGSIDGRVAIHDFNAPNDQKKTYNYKCHRDGGSKPGAGKYSSQPTQVYSVNDIAFNSINTFATVGSDGVFAFWDKDARSRLSIHERFKNQAPITCGVFSPNDAYFFYALSYDWSKGADGYQASMPLAIYAHPVAPNEIRSTKK